ncbi:MAG: helix-turn-helix transcriptional regulator [Thermomicrobiales bacterium]|jgi:DNA-binding PadR family transcriptional regulator|nr:helix-turn-helix transcriptional regulator [Thermomicrobiales bacterium]
MSRTPATKASSEPVDEQPGSYALLGLIEQAGGSSHGYSLLQEFVPGKPLADIIQLNPSMLYHLLKRLAAREWIIIEQTAGGAPRSRQRCRITPAGRDELTRWILTPVAHTRELRLEFLVKLAVARMICPDLEPDLVDEQITLCHAWRDSMVVELEQLSEKPESSSGFKPLVLSLRLNQTESACRWLEELLP